MTVGEWSEAFGRITLKRRLQKHWWAVAYLGRYAGQQYSEVMSMTARNVNSLAAEVEKIIVAEMKDPSKSTFVSDDDDPTQED